MELSLVLKVLDLELELLLLMHQTLVRILESLDVSLQCLLLKLESSILIFEFIELSRQLFILSFPLLGADLIAFKLNVLLKKFKLHNLVAMIWTFH